MTEVTATFVFVDLAGFTALTEAHTDFEAAALVDRFEALATETAQPDGRLIKSMGDEVFLSFPDPATALGSLERLLQRCASEPGFPLPRAGLHHGSAISRGEDLIGSSVNLAARIAGQAHGAQVLSSAGVAAVARTQEIHVVELGDFDLRNITEPVTLFQLDLYPEAAGSAVDPVCRMTVPRSEAAGRLRHHDADYWFCSLGCVAKFAAQPDAYASAEPPPASHQ